MRPPIFLAEGGCNNCGLYGICASNVLCQNLFEFMRDDLPKNISLSSDLTTINELYQNNKTNRVMSSSKNEYININLNKVSGNTALDFE